VEGASLAIDPRHYLIEVLVHIPESLPSADVRITKFDHPARQVSVEGEANYRPGLLPWPIR
jgi:hypothetical protein